MIKEAYCSKEVSELLREKGFLKGVDLRFISNLAFYGNIGLQYNIAKWYDSLIQDKINFVVAPTHQMAMTWLREEKGIAIIPILSSICDNEKFFWHIKVVVAKNHKTYQQGWVYEQFENAIEAALKYTLENLI